MVMIDAKPSADTLQKTIQAARSMRIILRSGTHCPRQFREAVTSVLDAFHSAYLFCAGNTKATQNMIPIAVNIAPYNMRIGKFK